jgi:hypothetical protein
MGQRLRKLNDEGVRRFAEYLAEGALSDAPLSLLENPETSDPLPVPITTGRALFEDRFQFGTYLKSLLSGLEAASITGDRNLWTSLALLWFDRICPPSNDGTRVVGKEYRYILSTNYRDYYRHLIRTPWYLVRQHGENAQFLLLESKKGAHSLSVHGDLLEQIGGRQQVFASRPLVAVARRLYSDKATGRPRRGVAGRGPGAANRFGLVLRQLDLTYDPEVMSDEELIKILPSEFERWKTAPGGQPARLHPAGSHIAVAAPG